MAACQGAVRSGATARRVPVWETGVADYRLDELAKASGISARNIRAYRERGLLDPPTRAGRTVLYGDAHLAQLEMISELFGRGYTSTHIAEFFARMNEGHDVADILGLQRAVLGSPREAGDESDAPHPLALDPADADAARLVNLGLAEVIGGSVVLIDAKLADIVAAAPDQLLCVQTIVRIQETAGTAVDDLARRVVDSLREQLVWRYGADHIPEPSDMNEFREHIQSYRDLAVTLAAIDFERALEQQMPDAVSDYTAGIMRGREAGTP